MWNCICSFKTVVLKLKKVKKLYMPLNEHLLYAPISGQVVLEGAFCPLSYIIIIIDFIKGNSGWERLRDSSAGMLLPSRTVKTRIYEKTILLLPVPGLSLLQITFRKEEHTTSLSVVPEEWSKTSNSWRKAIPFLWPFWTMGASSLCLVR